MKAHSGGFVFRREGGATELCSHGNPVHTGSRVLIQGGGEEKQEWSFWRLVLLPAAAGLGWSDSAAAARGRVRNAHVEKKQRDEGLSGTRLVSELVWSCTSVGFGTSALRDPRVKGAPRSFGSQPGLSEGTRTSGPGMQTHHKRLEKPPSPRLTALWLTGAPTSVATA